MTRRRRNVPGPACTDRWKGFVRYRMRYRTMPEPNLMNLMNLMNLAKATEPSVIAQFPVHRHGRSRIEALSGILPVAMCLIC